ncbi:MAG: hypothetical protein JWN75_237 [Candidatus Saccharibacteria bacterium]|nr:hypothetical protein [Candidatus Saccharibacteria bacterium]
MKLSKEEDAEVLEELVIEWEAGLPYEDRLKTDIHEWFEDHGRDDQEEDEDGIIVYRMFYVRVSDCLYEAPVRRRRFIKYSTIAGEINRDTSLTEEARAHRILVLGLVWASLVMTFDVRYTIYPPPEDYESDTDPADE